MENWSVAAFIFAAVAVGMIAQGWVSWLEHKRRTQALDIIKATIEAGREPPQQLYDQLQKADEPKPPWSEVVIFAALAFGFWLAVIYGDNSHRTAFIIIAATMTVTSIGCLVLAIARPGSNRRSDDKR